MRGSDLARKPDGRDTSGTTVLRANGARFTHVRGPRDDQF